jgi:hypothetical protein
MAALAYDLLRLPLALAAFSDTFSSPVPSACRAVIPSSRLGLADVPFIEIEAPITHVLGLLAQVGIDRVPAGHQFIAGDAHERYKHFTRPSGG